MDLSSDVPQEFAVAFLELMTHHGRPTDEEFTEVRVYWARMQRNEVPLPLAIAAIDRAIDTRKFFPRVPELLEDAEACRREISARLPFVACPACRDRRPGWVCLVDAAGVRREARCDCWTAHQGHLAAGGFVPRPVYRALPSGDGAEEAYGR